MEYQLLYLDSVPLKSPRSGDAGYDLPMYSDVTIEPKSTRAVKTGLAVAIPEGYCGIIYGRSGNAFKHDLIVIHQGVIDSSYRGEIAVLLYNHNNFPIRLSHGDMIAQLVVQRVYTEPAVDVPNLPNSERGPDGFGSTGLAGEVQSVFEEN